MVLSTMISSINGLPLAASVDDEQVRSLTPASRRVFLITGKIDGKQFRRIQTASQADLQAINAAIRVEMLHRIWRLFFTVRAKLMSSRMSTEMIVHTHSYLINNEIVYLTIASGSYPRRLAFSYLDELSKEFERSFGGS